MLPSSFYHQHPPPPHSFTWLSLSETPALSSSLKSWCHGQVAKKKSPSSSSPSIIIYPHRHHHRHYHPSSWFCTCVSERLRFLASSFLSCPTTYWFFSNACDVNIMIMMMMRMTKNHHYICPTRNRFCSNACNNNIIMTCFIITITIILNLITSSKLPARASTAGLVRRPSGSVLVFGTAEETREDGALQII